VAVVLLVFGILAGSTSVIFNKLSGLHPLLLAAGRQLVAALVLLPLAVREARRDGLRASALLRTAALPGLVLALHFVTWIAGSRQTLAANAALIVNLVPLVMPFLLVFAIGERVRGGEIAGSVLALAGVVVLGASDLKLARTTLQGDVLCLVSMLTYAVYLVLARRNRASSGLWAYVVPLYAIGGLSCLVAALAGAGPLTPPAPRELLYVLGLALVPTVIGHTVLNASMRRLRGQVVSVIAMAEFVFAGVIAFLVLGERPSPFFYPAAALVVLGAVATAAAGGGRRRAP
jgi:drug/metabolite transporter (DMT)-like permease